MGPDTNKPSYPTDEMKKWQERISTMLNRKKQKNRKLICESNTSTMTPEMKRIEALIEAKAGKKNTSNCKAASKTGMTENCMDIKVTDVRKRDMNKNERECPICGYILTQTAAFLKHLKNNHGIEKIDNINMRLKCKFCGMIVDENSFNYHVRKHHREIYEKKI